MAIQGDTVRLCVHFRTFKGVSIQPKTISLVIYDNAQEVLQEFTEDELEQEGTGQYYFDYEIPDDVQNFFIYEYRGIHNDKPILNRGKVKVKFNKS